MSSIFQDRRGNLWRKNIMLLRLMEEEWTPIVLKAWASKTISGCLKAKVGGKQVHLGTFAPIKGKSFWQ